MLSFSPQMKRHPNLRKVTRLEPLRIRPQILICGDCTKAVRLLGRKEATNIQIFEHNIAQNAVVVKWAL